MASRNPLKHFIETQVFAVTVFSKESIDLYNIPLSLILSLWRDMLFYPFTDKDCNQVGLVVSPQIPIT